MMQIRIAPETASITQRDSRFKQGLFTPKHPEKYIGDVNKIRYMSSWELDCHIFLDSNPNIISWGSEVVIVPYLSPYDGKIHKYLIDYFVQYVDKNGNTIVELIEVKPKKQTKPPKKGTKTYAQDLVTWNINLAKWKSAKDFAMKKGWKFRIATESSIFR